MFSLIIFIIVILAIDIFNIAKTLEKPKSNLCPNCANEPDHNDNCITCGTSVRNRAKWDEILNYLIIRYSIIIFGIPVIINSCRFWGVNEVVGIFLSFIGLIFCNEYKKKKRDYKEKELENSKKAQKSIMFSRIFEFMQNMYNSENQTDFYQYVRKVASAEIMVRVKNEALNQKALLIDISKSVIFSEQALDDEIKKFNKPKNDRIQKFSKLKEIMSTHGISDEWIIRNGGFKKRPAWFPSADIGKMCISSLMRVNYEQEQNALGTYNLHVFGHNLNVNSIDEINDLDLDFMINFEDRLVSLFKTIKK